MKIVACDTIVAFDIPLIALLTSLHVLWREENLEILLYSKLVRICLASNTLQLRECVQNLSKK
jgi:hypothetical protein